jgi:hypothetical protein
MAPRRPSSAHAVAPVARSSAVQLMSPDDVR